MGQQRFTPQGEWLIPVSDQDGRNKRDVTITELSYAIKIGAAPVLQVQDPAQRALVYTELMATEKGN